MDSRKHLSRLYVDTVLAGASAKHGACDRPAIPLYISLSKERTVAVTEHYHRKLISFRRVFSNEYLVLHCIEKAIAVGNFAQVFKSRRLAVTSVIVAENDISLRIQEFCKIVVSLYMFSHAVKKLNDGFRVFYLVPYRQIEFVIFISVENYFFHKSSPLYVGGSLPLIVDIILYVAVFIKQKHDIYLINNM